MINLEGLKTLTVYTVFYLKNKVLTTLCAKQSEKSKKRKVLEVGSALLHFCCNRYRCEEEIGLNKSDVTVRY